MKNSKKDDIRKGIVQRFIDALANGTPPWIAPWDENMVGQRPSNPVTGRQYSGINVSILWSEAIRSGYDNDRWLTLRQANSLGGRVKKGQRGTTVVFYKKLKVHRRQSGSDDIDAEEMDVIKMMRTYTVFNIDQCTGLPSSVVSSPSPAQWTELSSVCDFVKASGAEIVHGKDTACYVPKKDRIKMPAKAAFKDRAGYYPTLFHEMIHWTGHSSRLDRTGIRQGSIGSTEYAFEELVAEIGSAYLCADFGIQGELRHEAYVASWIEVLDSDPKAIFNAAAQAEQAVSFLKEAVQAGI